MTCTSCQGLMIAEDLVDLQERNVPMWMRGWCGIACGDSVDSLISCHLRTQALGRNDILQSPMRVVRTGEGGVTVSAVGFAG